MNTILLVVLVLILLFVCVEEIRAHRKHERILTLMHSDLAHGMEEVRAKVDGGTRPK